MKSKAAIGAHPIHPALVPIPIGAFFLVLVGDVAHAITPNDPFWYDLSFTCLGVGLITAVLAAVFGAIDYLGVPMSRKAFQIATWHAAANGTALIFMAGTFLLRRHGDAAVGPRWPVAFALFLIGFTILGVGGWIGGKLAYEHRVGVVEDAPAPRSRSASAAS